MKTTRSLLILIVVMSLMACSSQLHVVTLYVDTTQIDQTNIEQYASFGQPAGIANKDFITHVRKGDQIIWDAVSISNPSDEVKITAINHISGERIFERKLRKGQPQSGTKKQGFVKELISGAIEMKPDRLKAYIEEKYGIEFTVANKEGPFKIDPVIRSHRK